MIGPPPGTRLYLACGVTDILGRTAQQSTPRQRFVHSRQDLFVSQYLVSMDHPVLMQIRDLVGCQLVTEVEPVRAADQSRFFPPHRLRRTYLDVEDDG